MQPCPCDLHDKKGEFIMPLPRMRTAKYAMDEIRAQDPNTEISLRFIRSVVNTGKIPVVCVGRKKLFDMDCLLEILKTDLPVAEEQEETGRIRRVDL